MENKEAERPGESPQKPIGLQKKESEISIEAKESLKPSSSKYTDEIIEGLDKISIPELDQPGGWIKLLITIYKEKAYENRTLQDKIKALNTTSSDLSNKLGVARERLRHISGKGVAVGFLNIIAGAILAFVTALPDTKTRTILFSLAISIFAVCAIYHSRSGSNQKDIEESERLK